MPAQGTVVKRLPNEATAASAWASRLRPGGDVGRHGAGDVLAVGPQRLFLAVVLQVNGKLVHSESPQLLQPAKVMAHRTHDAEPVNDLVRDKSGVDVAGPTVLVVVIALATADVGRQGRRDRAIGPVPGDDIGDVVADHAPE